MVDQNSRASGALTVSSARVYFSFAAFPAAQCVRVCQFWAAGRPCSRKSAVGSLPGEKVNLPRTGRSPPPARRKRAPETAFPPARIAEINARVQNAAPLDRVTWGPGMPPPEVTGGLMRRTKDCGHAIPVLPPDPVSVPSYRLHGVIFIVERPVFGCHSTPPFHEHHSQLGLTRLACICFSLRGYFCLVVLCARGLHRKAVYFDAPRLVDLGVSSSHRLRWCTLRLMAWDRAFEPRTIKETLLVRQKYSIPGVF